MRLRPGCSALQNYASILLYQAFSNLVRSSRRVFFSSSSKQTKTVSDTIGSAFIAAAALNSGIFRFSGHCILKNAVLSTGCYPIMGQNMGQAVFPFPRAETISHRKTSSLYSIVFFIYRSAASPSGTHGWH